MRKIVEYMKKLTDPATKQATAFYASLVAVCLDSYHRGFHLWNTVLIGALCGVGVTGLLTALFYSVKDKAPD